jgi:hypothetical protein
MFMMLIALLPTGCSLFLPEAELGIVLPAPPEHWRRAFPGLGARIVFPDAAGRMHEVALPRWDAPAVISCPKTGTTPVLAWPLAGNDVEQGQAGCGALRPAGGFYPFSLGGDGRSLELSWAGGAVGYVLQLLRSRGMDCSHFNAPRLSAYIGRDTDPWDLDLQGIAQKIALGVFTAYDIDTLPQRDLLARPGPGEWFLESPFSAIQVPDAQGVIMLRGLCDGTHTLFSVEGGMLRIAVNGTGAMTIRIH